MNNEARQPASVISAPARIIAILRRCEFGLAEKQVLKKSP
jgi:hypothetical protein